MDGQQILLLDIAGRVVLDTKATGNETSIATHIMDSGWYMLAVQNAQGVVVYRTKVGVTR